MNFSCWTVTTGPAESIFPFRKQDPGSCLGEHQEETRRRAQSQRQWGLYEAARGFPGGAILKKSPASAGNAGRDAGSIPRSGRSPRGGYGNPLQYSCWENSTHTPVCIFHTHPCRVYWATPGELQSVGQQTVRHDSMHAHSVCQGK